MKNIIIITLVLIFSTKVNSQELRNIQLSNAKSFCNALFISNDSINTEIFAQKYLIFHDKLSKSERMKMLSAHIDYVKKSKQILFNKDNFKVLAFDSLDTILKPPFKKVNSNDIYSIVSNEKVVLLILFEMDKILSFEYILKGENDAYFITY